MPWPPADLLRQPRRKSSSPTTPEQAQREASAEAGEVDGHVEAGAAGDPASRRRSGHVLRRRQPVDDLVDVDADAAAAEDAIAPWSQLLQHGLGDRHVVLQRAQRLETLLLQLAVIGAHRLLRRDLPSATWRIIATMASGDSARLILRPNRATRAPYFSAWCSSSKQSRVVPAPPPSTPTIRLGSNEASSSSAFGPL